MYCDFCINAKIPGDKSAFIKGSINHCYVATKHENEKEPAKAPAFITKMSLNKAIYFKLTILFRTVHDINIQGRPT